MFKILACVIHFKGPQAKRLAYMWINMLNTDKDYLLFVLNPFDNRNVHFAIQLLAIHLIKST